MKRTKEMKKEWIAELKKMQKSYQGEISPDDLPFDLTAELGEVVTVELKSPGVYYIATKKAGDIPECPEVYVVTADAPAISEKAWTYGQEFPGHPDLRVYDILQPKSGRYIIDFENATCRKSRTRILYILPHSMERKNIRIILALSLFLPLLQEGSLYGIRPF